MISQQLQQFCAALLAGMGMGLCFWCFQRFYYGTGRQRRFPHRRSRRLADLLYALIQIALWLLFWFSATKGELRASVFLWLAAGLFLYSRFLHPRFAKVKLPKRSRDKRKKRHFDPERLLYRETELLGQLQQQARKAAARIGERFPLVGKKKEE